MSSHQDRLHSAREALYELLQEMRDLLDPGTEERHFLSQLLAKLSERWTL